MLYLLWLMLFFNMCNSSYLTSNESNVSYIDIPEDEIISRNKWPRVGFGCAIKSPNTNHIYYVTSTQTMGVGYYYNKVQQCEYSKKYVEILKYNLENNIFEDKLLIGEQSAEYTLAQGNLGNDNIVSCGIDKNSNILYYIGNNKYDCETNYNFDSGLVRINLQTMSFIDRTNFRQFPGVEKFSPNIYYEYKYIQIPTTSVLSDNYLWLGFGGYYTGIWKLDITTPVVQLVDQFQYIYERDIEHTMTGETQKVDVYFSEIKKSFKNVETGLLYFLQDNGYGDSLLLEINGSLPLIKNNTRLITLDGLTRISDIEVDTFLKKIYVVAGALTSEIYQYNYDFDRLPLNENCNIDFLKMPTNWGVITNIEVDVNTGYIYAIISTRYDNSGVVKINAKDMEIEMDSYQIFSIEEQYSNNYVYTRYLNNLNISFMDFNYGKLILAPNSYNYYMKLASVELMGCSPGRGIKNDFCEICERGKYSSSHGGFCEYCNPGYSSDKFQSIFCTKCMPGKYSNGLNTIYCDDCPKGYYSKTEGSNNCDYCLKGKYSTVDGSDTIEDCLECEAGKISDNGADDCNFCEIGKWARKRTSCRDCPKGRYSYSLGLVSGAECSQCPIGKYSDELGIINENDCKECVEGYIGLVEGAPSNDSCIKCDRGKYREDLDLCKECDPGQISGSGAEECEECPEGKLSDMYGLECLSCQMGRYNNLRGLTYNDVCKGCEKGKYSNITGAEEENACKDCPLGKFNIETGLISIDLCKSCDSGKYRGQNDNPGDKCKICDNGKYSEKESSECKDCPAGKYSNDNEENKFSYCVDCPSGRYNEISAQHSINVCKYCSSGKWSSTISSKYERDCIDCPVGFYSETEGASLLDTCLNCPEGTFNDDTGIDNLNNCKKCSAGMFSGEGASNCSYCEEGKYSSNIGSNLCVECSKGRYSNETGTILCNECPPNTEQNSKKTKCECSSGFYYDKKEKVCVECDAISFICPKGTVIETMILKKEYWRSSNDTTMTYKCKNIYSCSGGIINRTTDSLCYPGHMGPICDVCKKGWAKNDGVCFECPENTTTTMSLTILIPIICIFLVIFLIKTANPATNKKEEVNGVVKIFMNYAQVFSLASSFQINWPTIVRYFFERAKEFSSPRVSFYSSDCTIGWSYYDKLLIYLIMPLFYIFVVTIMIFIVTALFCRNKKNKIKKIKSNEEKERFKKSEPGFCKFFIAWEKTAIVVGTFLSWPTVVQKILEVMNCEKIGDKYYLVKDLSVECYTYKHNTFLTASYIGLIVYGIGIPLLGFRLLYNYRYRLFDLSDRYNGSTPLSFLFLGYREKRWYYEFIIMGKKASLIVISVFLRSQPRYQIIAASLMVQISFFLHVFLRPYDTITNYGMICNKLESVSLLSLVATLSTGLFFGTIESGYELGTFEDILIVFVLLCNGVISLYFFYYFVSLTLKSLKSHLRDYLKIYYSKDNNMLCCRCFDKEKQNKIKKWAMEMEFENYGVDIKNSAEKEIFTNYFKEKKSKLDILNDKIDKIPQRRLSIKMDKIRSKIEIMEKQRCWQTVLNNRLYNEMKEMIQRENLKVTDIEFKQLKKIVNTHMNYGIEYNDRMNYLLAERLNGMIEKTDSSVSSNSPKSSVLSNNDDNECKTEASEESIVNIMSENIKFFIEEMDGSREEVIIV